MKNKNEKQKSINSIKPDEFISKIIEVYTNSKAFYEGNNDMRLSRGKQPSISSLAEGLFAKFISSNFPSSDLRFIVEPILSFSRPSKKSKQRIVPDLAIIHNEVVTHYFDLKMDLGFTRNLKKYITRKDLLIKDMRGKTTTKTWLGKFQFSSDLIYQMVIISKQNANKYLDEYLEFSTTLDTAKVYILTNGAHPNSKMGRTSVQENDEEFEKLFSDIEKQFI